MNNLLQLPYEFFRKLLFLNLSFFYALLRPQIIRFANNDIFRCLNIQWQHLDASYFLFHFLILNICENILMPLRNYLNLYKRIRINYTFLLESLYFLDDSLYLQSIALLSRAGQGIHWVFLILIDIYSILIIILNCLLVLLYQFTNQKLVANIVIIHYIDKDIYIIQIVFS